MAEAARPDAADQRTAVEGDAGVRALYRALFDAARARLTPARRWWIAVGVEAFLVAAFFLIRTGDLRDVWMARWTFLFAATCLLAPASGLTVLVLVAPFPEWLGFGRETGFKFVSIVLMGFGVQVRWLLAGERARLAAPLRLAIVLWAGLGLTVLQSTLTFGAEFGWEATRRWLSGLGGGMIVFAVAFWAAQRGSLRPAIAAVVGVTLSAAVNLLEYVRPESIRNDWFGWMVRRVHTADRISGTINGPNAIATVTSAAFGVVLAAIAELRQRGRFVLFPVATLLAAVVFLTFSRSGILAMFLILVLVVARRNPRRALVVLVVGLVAFVLLTPLYLQFRAAALGAGTVTDLGTLLSGDIKRWTGWTTGLRLWLDSPIVGSGLLSFFELRARYGVTLVSHPHNEVIRLLAEGGLLAGLTFVAFVATTAAELWRSRSALGLAGAAALTALVTGAQFNNPFHFIAVLAPGMAVVGGTAGGVLAGRHEGSEDRSAAGPQEDRREDADGA